MNPRNIGELLLLLVIARADAFCILRCIFPKFYASRHSCYCKKRCRYEFNNVFIHKLLVYNVVNDIRNVLSKFIPGFLSGLDNYLTQFRKLRREILPLRKFLQ